MKELDVVRLKETVTGENAYEGGMVTVPAGTDGTIIVAGNGGGDVEFILTSPEGDMYSVVLIVDYDQVDLVWEYQEKSV